MSETTSESVKCQHTPGPWTFDDMWSLIMAGKYEIAAVHAARTHDETNKRKRLDEVNANARLIASAPDLLEACKVACEALNMAGEHYHDEWRKCKDAISRATQQ